MKESKKKSREGCVKSKKNIDNLLNICGKNINEIKENFISFDVIMGLNRLKNLDPKIYNMEKDDYNKLLLNIIENMRYRTDKCNKYLKVITYLSDKNTKKDILLKYFNVILEIYVDSFKILNYSKELEKYILSLDIHG